MYWTASNQGKQLQIKEQDLVARRTINRYVYRFIWELCGSPKLMKAQEWRYVARDRFTPPPPPYSIRTLNSVFFSLMLICVGCNINELSRTRVRVSNMVNFKVGITKWWPLFVRTPIPLAKYDVALNQTIVHCRIVLQAGQTLSCWVFPGG